MPGTVPQLASVSPMEPVASSTNITFSGFTVEPALAAVAVEVSVKDERPNALRKKVETVPVWVSVTAFGFVPLQVGRFDVEVTHLNVGVGVPVIVTPATGLAVFQLVIAVLTAVVAVAAV